MPRWWPWSQPGHRRRRRSVDGVRVSVEGPFLVGPLRALPSVFQRNGLASGAVFTALTQAQVAVLTRERGVALHQLVRGVESVAQSVLDLSTHSVGLGGTTAAGQQYTELCWLEDNLRAWEEQFGLTFSWMRTGAERRRRPVCPGSLGAFWQLCSALGLAQVRLAQPRDGTRGRPSS